MYHIINSARGRAFRPGQEVYHPRALAVHRRPGAATDHWQGLWCSPGAATHPIYDRVLPSDLMPRAHNNTGSDAGICCLYHPCGNV